MKNIIEYKEAEEYNSFIDSLIKVMANLKLEKDDNVRSMQSKLVRLSNIASRQNRSQAESLFRCAYDKYTSDLADYVDKMKKQGNDRH